MASGAVAGGQDWRPTPGQRLDIQLSAPFDFNRAADILVVEPFGAAPERLRQLRARGVATVCYLAAGLWQNWRPDAPSFPERTLGRSPTGWPGERWLDIRDHALPGLLGRRLDLCRERGFDGALLAGLDGHVQRTGFDLTAAQQLAFNRGLAAAAHERGLAVGIVNDLGQAGELAGSFDFLVADRCVAEGDCGGVRPFQKAGKPLFLVAYTRQPSRMAAYCALAAEIEAPLILKTQSLNGKLHRRCGEPADTKRRPSIR